jgi:hypothetical protein
MTDHAIAHALASDLAEAEVDPNEAQKTLAYLRSKQESDALFDYLQAVVTNGRVVIRSNRTLGYYTDLEKACRKHLTPLKKDYPVMLQTFAWSLRLLRYYRQVPESVRDEIFLPRTPPPRSATRKSSSQQPTQPQEQKSTSADRPAQPQEQEPAPAPESFKPKDMRIAGVIAEVATQDKPGQVEDGEGKRYSYNLDDVIGTQPEELALVRFNPERRKVPVKKGKKKVEKYVPWAEDVEVQGG